MKKINLFLAFLLLSFAIATAQIPTNGLVAYYPFNGNANDESGNNNTGTVNGATLTSDRFGNVGKAFSFDGVSNTIVVPNSSSINLTTNEITISYWIKWQGNSIGGKGISKGGVDFGSGYELMFTGLQSNNGAFEYSINSGSLVIYNVDQFQGQWINVIGVLKNGYGKIFINGELFSIDSVFSNVTSSIIANNHDLYIGTRDPANNYVSFLLGSIDDIRIYNRALSSTEIMALYNESIIATQPISQAICENTNTKFVVAANGTNLTYQWQSFSSTWSNLSNIGAFADVTNDTLTITATPLAFNGMLFRCMVSNGTTTDTSNAVTLNVVAPGTTLTDTINKFIHDGRDCQNYPIVKIGNQWWMQKNLNTAKYADGSVIPNVTDNTAWSNLTTGALSYYNNDSAQYAATYGPLYNWYAVNDSRGVCPNGWHVSTDAEWNIMEKYLDNTVDTDIVNNWTGTDIGAKLKEAGTTHWSSPNAGAINSSNFTALPGGYRFNDGSFGTNNGDWWTTVSSGVLDQWYRALVYNSAQIGHTTNNGTAKYGFSVRCIKSQQSNQSAVFNVQPLPTNACEGQTTMFIASSINSNQDYKWQSNETGTWMNLMDTGKYSGALNDTLIITNIPLSLNGVQYSCAVHAIGSQEATFSDSAMLSVNQNPTAALGNDTTFCGTSLTLHANASGGSGTYSYLWSSGCTEAACSVSTTGIYYATVVDNNNCTATDSIHITNSQPINIGQFVHSSQGMNISNGLVAYYPFNGNAHDESGNENNGTVNGATLAMDRFGNTGKAYSFDGVGNYIDINSVNATDLPSVIEEMNMSLFFKSSALTLNNVALNLCTGSRISISNDSIIGTAYLTNGLTQEIKFKTDSNWNFVSFNYKRNNKIELYVNGTFSGSINLLGNQFQDECWQMCSAIGMYYYCLAPGYNYGFFNGSIDDIRIYNRALTPTEITALYNENAALAVSLSKDTICGAESTDLSINNAQVGVNYQYSVNGGQYAAGQVGNGTSQIVNLQSSIFNQGNNTITIKATDTASNCSIVLDTVLHVFKNANALTLNLGANTGFCTGGSATLHAVVTGGTAPYNYNWSTNCTDAACSVSTAGTFSVAVIQNGCSASDTILVSEYSIPAVTISGDTSICRGETTILTANVTGGTTPFFYSWSPGYSVNATYTVSPLVDNQYFVTVTDVNGCASITTTAVYVHQKPIINTILGGGIGQPNPDDIRNYYVTNVAGHTFQWFVVNGHFTTASNASTVSVYWETVGLGILKVVEINQYGCVSDTVTKTVNIGFSCTGLSATATAHSLACHGTCNGFIVANATGGNQPYNYQWSGNATGQNLSTAYNLCAGSYTVTVTDYFNCIFTATAILTEPSAIALSASTTNASCGLNNATGTALASATGGVSPYHFVWSNGNQTALADSLDAGLYVVTVTDGNNCSTFSVAQVNSAGGATLTIDNITPVSCKDGSNGAINISVTGGTQPYTFVWSNGATTEDISGVTDGAYDVEVYDASHCEAVASFSVSEPQEIQIQHNITNASCGLADGTISLNVTGGTSPYTYLWSNGATTATLNGLVTGTYNVTVTDSHGCTKSPICEITMNNQDGPVAVLDSVHGAGCGSANGGIWVHVTGGAQPYTYAWSNAGAASYVTGIAAAIYNLTVTDANGCKGTFSANVGSKLPQVQQICMVSVDSASSKNLVIWEKVEHIGISYYKIYKEGSHANQYQHVGIRSADTLSVWRDMASNPFSRSWRYKISSVDSCGNESPQSQEHKTIHLNQNQGIGNFVNLIWDVYNGYNYDQFIVYRWRPSQGVIALDTIPATLTSYTDFNVPNGLKRYFIAAVKLNGLCAPLSSKDMSGPFSQSLSNIEDNGIISVKATETAADAANCNIYPNPSDNKFIIEYNENGVAELMDLNGKIVKTIALQNAQTVVDFTEFASGIYTIRIKTEKAVIVKKIVKE